MNQVIYLDNHSTTPVDERVAGTVMDHMLGVAGNPSSLNHVYGELAQRALDQATERVRDLTDAGEYRLIFTSGSTESINLAIRGFVSRMESKGLRGRRVRIGLTVVEHPAVSETCRHLKAQGRASLTWFSVDQCGRLDLREIEAALEAGLDLICVMAANNVMGTIYPIAQVAALAQQYGAQSFVDATQAAGHGQFLASQWGTSAFALSGHKMYGPKGVGALLFAPGFPITAQMSGGGQQFGLRPGTIDVPGVAGFGKAAELRNLEYVSDTRRIRNLRDRLQAVLQEFVPDMVVFGDQSQRLPGNLSFAVPGIPNSAIVARVQRQLCVATGAACSSGIEQPSPVLQAMGIDDRLAEGHIRIGIGKFNEASEIEDAAGLIIEAVADIREVMANV